MSRLPVRTTAQIKEGFEKFIQENGRLPKATEIDSLSYLPSSRMIQRRLGGLESLRKELGYNTTHFGKGEHRSRIAFEVGPRGRKLEIALEGELQKHFGEMCVHTEKIFHGRLRVDFYIYTPNGNFGIDIFYPDTMHTLQSNVNIKMKKYRHFNLPIYLAVANPEFSQNELATYTSNKKYPLPTNVSLVTLPTLTSKFLAMDCYTVTD